MRLIDVDAFKIEFCEKCNNVSCDAPLTNTDCFTMYMLDNTPTIEAEPVRHGRCDMCEIMGKGHGRIRLYQGSGWQVAIGRGVDGYELVINHSGEHFATKIDYCPYCGAKMDGGVKE